MEENRRRIWELMNEDSLFEYQFREDSLSYTALEEGKIQDVRIPDFCGKRRMDAWIYPEDKKGAVYALFESDISLGQVVSFELRMKSRNEPAYTWHRILYMTLLDEQGGRGRILGRIINIERQKRQERAISESLETDVDTGFLKKETMKRKADRYFAEEGNGKAHVLLCLELEDYKTILNMVGAEMMRAIVRYVGLCLKEVAGNTDLAGRTAPDCFVLLLKNISSEGAAVCVHEVETMLRSCYVEKERGIVLKGRIATACVPGDGLSFEGLLQKAEQELSIGRLKEAEEPAAEAIQELSDRELFSRALRILTMGKDKEDAAARIFKETAEKLDLDLILTLKPGTEERLLLEYAFKDGRIPTEGVSEEISADSRFDPYLHQYEVLAINDCRRVLEENEPFLVKTGARGAVFCFCIYKHDFIGTLVFADTEKERDWTDYEKRTLYELSDILWPSLFHLAEQGETEKKVMDALCCARETSRAKDAFISNMSHEIRTPLNAIMGIADFIKNHAGEAEKVREYAGKLEQSSRYLLHILNDCLDVSKIESGNAAVEADNFQLSVLLDSIEKEWFCKAEEKGITVHKENFAGDYILRGDQKRARIILENVLDNAIKFTPEGGNIWLSVNRIYQRANRINLRFQIGDDGIGMSEEFLKQIYVPFSQERLNRTDPFGGSGLGMTVCRDMIMLLHGTIRIKSKPGSGTEIIIELPFEVNKEAAKDKEMKRNPAVSRKADFHGKRILLAEDNSLNAEIARMMLEEDGFSVDCVSNGKRAAERFEKKPPYYYDVILMDIRMPLMDGWEAAKAIRGMEKADSGTVPIVAMTANAFNEDVIKSFASGMNDHVSKPIERTRLIGVLEKLLTERGTGEKSME